MKLHVFPPSPRATKVLALAEHLGLGCEIQIVDLFKGEHKAPAFTALNLNQRMPVLEDGDFVLWESNAILAYLASKKPESGLWPSDARGQAEVIRWFSWDCAHWAPALSILILEHFIKKVTGQGEPDAAEVARGEAEFHRYAPVLEAHLAGRPWLLGRELTVADFSVAYALAMAEAARYPLATYPQIVGWYRRFGELPGWKKSLVPPLS